MAGMQTMQDGVRQALSHLTDVEEKRMFGGQRRMNEIKLNSRAIQGT